MSTKANKKPAGGRPTYAEMISAAIVALHVRGGSSRQAIYKYVCANYQVDPNKAALFVRKALTKGVEGGLFKRAKESGKGAGCFKLVKKEKTAKPPVAKKSAPKVAKPAAKKSAPKVKPAGGKSTQKA